VPQVLPLVYNGLVPDAIVENVCLFNDWFAYAHGTEFSEDDLTRMDDRGRQFVLSSPTPPPTVSHVLCRCWPFDNLLADGEKVPVTS